MKNGIFFGLFQQLLRKEEVFEDYEQFLKFATENDDKQKLFCYVFLSFLKNR